VWLLSFDGVVSYDHKILSQIALTQRREG
jgi:hypothetical protein